MVQELDGRIRNAEATQRRRTTLLQQVIYSVLAALFVTGMVYQQQGGNNVHLDQARTLQVLTAVTTILGVATLLGSYVPGLVLIPYAALPAAYGAMLAYSVAFWARQTAPATGAIILILVAFSSFPRYLLSLPLAEDKEQGQISSGEAVYWTTTALIGGVASGAWFATGLLGANGMSLGSFISFVFLLVMATGFAAIPLGSDLRDRTVRSALSAGRALGKVFRGRALR